MAAIRNLQKSTEPFKPHNMTSIPNGQSRFNYYIFAVSVFCVEFKNSIESSDWRMAKGQDVVSANLCSLNF